MTSNSRSDVAEIAARHDPAAWTRTFAYRSRSELPFDARAVPPSAGLLLDTTVYLDAMRFGLPREIAMLIRRNPLSHSAVACAEIAIAIGHLDPRHPSSFSHRGALENLLQGIPIDRVVAPSPDAWTEGAVVAGILARTQGFPRADRRELLFDALLLLTSVEQDAFLVSRNIRHMDLLLRLKPEAKVLLYDRP
jgi:hypothetical protein